MGYFTKLLSIIITTWYGGSFFTLISSLLIGYIVNIIRNFNITNLYYFSDKKIHKRVFFYTTFQVIGYLSKSKGRIDESDILNVNMLIKKMKLNTLLANEAKKAFQQGKNNNFSLRNQLHKFRQICFFRYDLISSFLKIQIQTAFADGLLHPNERKILYVIAEELGISYDQFDQFINMMEKEKNFNRQDKNSQFNYNQSYKKQKNSIENACEILGVNFTDDILTIKRAYRKLISQYHPDKLISKGLPPQIIEIAKKKTQKIQQAYDILKKEKTLH